MTAALDKASPYFDQVRSEQVAMLVSTEQRTIPISMLVTVLLWSGLYYSGVATMPVAALWIGAHAAHAVLRVWMCQAYRSAAPGPRNWRHWIRLISVSSAA